jgi:hypothetical protein
MKKSIYRFQAGHHDQHPALLEIDTENGLFKISLRDHADVHHHENGAHFAPGQTTTLEIDPEHARELARAIVEEADRLYSADLHNFLEACEGGPVQLEPVDALTLLPEQFVGADPGDECDSAHCQHIHDHPRVG